MKAAKLLRWPHNESLTGVKETNGLAENAVKRVLSGIQGCLLQAGLEDKWWTYACRYFCFARRAKILEGDSIYNKSMENTLIKGSCTLSAAECISFPCQMLNGQRITNTKYGQTPFQEFPWVINLNTAADYARRNRLCYVHPSASFRATILIHLL